MVSEIPYNLFPATGKSPGARFSKAPKRFGRFSGDAILCLKSEVVSRHETSLLFKFVFPFQDMKRPALQNKRVAVLQMAFRARKVLGIFDKRGPAHKFCIGMKATQRPLHSLETVLFNKGQKGFTKFGSAPLQL